jgi:hypothetical protein
MRVQGLLDLGKNRLVKTVLADHDHRLEVVAEASQVAELLRGQWHGVGWRSGGGGLYRLSARCAG